MTIEHGEIHVWREMCCEPDFDYCTGKYVHQDGCHGSVEANEEAEEMK